VAATLGADKIVAVGAARSGLLQGGRDRIWSGDGLVVRRREGAAVAQYHRRKETHDHADLRTLLRPA